MDARDHAMSRAFAWPVTEPAFLPIAVRPRLRRAIRRLDDTVDELIREQRDRAAPEDNLLSMLMDTHAGGRAACDSRQVRDEALNLLLASHKNVARALTYTVAAVARHPEVEARMRDEVADVLGERKPTGDDWRALRYTGMVVAESLRLWPPSPLLFRVARRDDVLPTGKRIRAGSKVLLSPYVLQRDPAYYPDPERFDPERFGDEAPARAAEVRVFPVRRGTARVYRPDALDTRDDARDRSNRAARPVRPRRRAAGLRLRLSAPRGWAPNAGAAQPELFHVLIKAAVRRGSSTIPSVCPGATRTARAMAGTTARRGPATSDMRA